MKKFIAAAALLLCLLMGAASAQEWYIDDGSIRVYADKKGQYVTQEGVADEVPDKDPVILQRDTTKPAANGISIRTVDDATANLTIRDLYLRNNSDLITVVHKSIVNLTVEGSNVLKNTDSMSSAVVSVKAGSLTILGDGTLELISTAEGAKIGSYGGFNDREGKEMSGTIHITDNVTIVTADDEDNEAEGAAIGSGYNAEMSGTILIDGNATVTAVSNHDGAGIGCGKGGNVSGSITIGGHATVTAVSTDGVSIGGSGEGSIVVHQNAVVNAENGFEMDAGSYSIQQGTVVNGNIVETAEGLSEEIAHNAEGLEIVLREQQEDHICWYGEWTLNGDGTHGTVCKKAGCTTATYCSERTVALNGETFTFCPICGAVEGGEALAMQEVTVKAMDGELPEGDCTVRTDGEVMTIAFEYSGKVVTCDAKIKLTVSGVTADKLVQVAEDGTETELECTAKGKKLTFELDFGGKDCAVLRLVNEEA